MVTPKQSPGDPEKASSELLASALASHADGVLILGRTGSGKGMPILYANDQFCALTGYTRELLLGKTHVLLHSDPEELKKQQRWLRSGAKNGDYESSGNLLRGDGKTLPSSWLYRPMGDRTGEWTHLIAIYRDVTEKINMQEALMTAQRLDAVGRMAGGVAHDFNNLLSVINGYCQVLGAKLASQPELLRDLEEIRRAGEKAAGLTRQLLALGRKQPVVMRPIDLCEFLHGCSEILERVVGESGQVEVHLSDKPLTVNADPDQLEQVLLNLALNARDSLRSKGLVSVSCARRDVRRNDPDRGDVTPGRYAVVTVKDNGVGMDADTMVHIFEPFFTTKSADKGSGLGLALVYGAVQQCGGFIQVKSALLVGSTFDLFFPLCEENDSVAPFAGHHGPKHNTKGHETIMLIESDIVLSRMVSGMLAAEGYHVLECSVPREAELMLRRESDSIHLLIVSIGDEQACKKLHGVLLETSPGTKVLCLSDCGVNCADAMRGKILHACFPKPFAISELLKAVRALLDS
jgi:PAS domain S-box-containing protein